MFVHVLTTVKCRVYDFGKFLNIGICTKGGIIQHSLYEEVYHVERIFLKTMILSELGHITLYHHTLGTILSVNAG